MGVPYYSLYSHCFGKFNINSDSPAENHHPWTPAHNHFVRLVPNLSIYAASHPKQLHMAAIGEHLCQIAG
jgi:hypothetical protein